MPQLEERFKTLSKFLEEGQYKDATNLMGDWKTTWLFQFCTTEPYSRLAYSLFKSDEFNGFFADKLQTLTPNVQFVPQDKTANIDFILGYVFYLQAIRAKGFPEYDTFLSNAIKHHSFHAIQTILHDIITNTDVAQRSQGLSSFVNHFSFLGTKFKTPGYLLLATAYQQISQLPHTSSFYREACKDLWVNLCLAEMSEEQSVPMIHNAYFGQGLRLSNPTQLSSIAEMKNAARALIVDIDSLTEEGQRIAEEIMSNKEDEARLVEWRRAKDRTSTPTSPRNSNQQDPTNTKPNPTL